MDQEKRWADYVCMCTFYLPASLSASGFQGAGRQNPGSSQSCARPQDMQTLWRNILKDENPSPYMWLVPNSFLGLRKPQPAPTDCTWKCQWWKTWNLSKPILLFPMLFLNILCPQVVDNSTYVYRSCYLCNPTVAINPMHGCNTPQVQILISLLWQWTWKDFNIGVMGNVHWVTNHHKLIDKKMCCQN